MSHRNARLTFHGRCLLIRHIRFDRRPVSHVAAELGVSRQCAHRWVKRFDAEGWDGLVERSSRPHRSPRRTPQDIEALVLAHRREQRQGPDRIAQDTGVPASTCNRILRRHGIPLLRECDPLTGEVIRASRTTAKRYEHDHPGSLIHVDVKKLGRIPDGGGWKANGRVPGGTRSQQVGFDYVHSAVDDHSRLAFSEVLPDEKGSTAASFLLRAAAFFAEHGVLIERVISDNAWCYRRSTEFKDAITAIHAKQLFIRPHCPWQNGKVERFNRTLQTEWAYRQRFDSNDQRTEALQPWLHYYNNQRNHSAIGGLPPISRCQQPRD